MFYVYIIQSEIDGSFYKGFSENYAQRLLQHNAGKSSYTSGKMPWKLIHVEVFNTKEEALRRERSLKKATRARILEIIKMPKNILNKTCSPLLRAKAESLFE